MIKQASLTLTVLALLFCDLSHARADIIFFTPDESKRLKNVMALDEAAITTVSSIADRFGLLPEQLGLSGSFTGSGFTLNMNGN